MSCKYNLLLCVNSGYVGKEATECLGCERDRLKSELEHPTKALCVQCHISQVDKLKGELDLALEAYRDMVHIKERLKVELEAALQIIEVLRDTPDGKIVWEASVKVKG